MDFFPFWHILSTLLESVNMSECLQKLGPSPFSNNMSTISADHPRKYKTSAILENKRLSSQDNNHQESSINSIRYHLNRDPDRALCKIIIGRPSGVWILSKNLRRVLCSKICESRWEVSQHCFQNQKIKQMFTFLPFLFWHFLPEIIWSLENHSCLTAMMATWTSRTLDFQSIESQVFNLLPCLALCNLYPFGNPVLPLTCYSW